MSGMNLKLLISPEAKGAYFGQYIDVAKAELAYVLDADASNIELTKKGGLDFLSFVPPDATPEPEPTAESASRDSQNTLRALARLSFVQGIFEDVPQTEGEPLLRPLPVGPDFDFHPDLVFGSKFRGKTNERLTQLLINLAVKTAGGDIANPDIKILDPMCGRGTTLLWGLRYGINARGIDADPKALAEATQIAKKWKKVHNEKLSFKNGSVGAKALTPPQVSRKRSKPTNCRL